MSDTTSTYPPAPIRLGVILGSTRPGRRATHIARWLERQLARRPHLDVDVIDLAELDLPAVLPADDDPRAQALTARIGAADAFLVVTPEYNHGYPASLKQAIDVPYREWNAKPVAFVSYGGMAGGVRAVEQLRQVFAEVHAVTTRDGVAFPFTRVDADGNAQDADGTAAAAATMLDQLEWWARALRDARAARPYGQPDAPPPAAPPATRSREQDRAAITKLFDDLGDGFNRRDVARADRAFTDDAVLVTPAGRRIEGIEALVRYHEQRLDGPARSWRTRYGVLGTRFLGNDVAVVHTDQEVVTGQGSFRNHGTFVVVRRDGRWRIVATHNTNVDDDERGHGADTMELAS